MIHKLQHFYCLKIKIVYIFEHFARVKFGGGYSGIKQLNSEVLTGINHNNS